MMTLAVLTFPSKSFELVQFDHSFPSSLDETSSDPLLNLFLLPWSHSGHPAPMSELHRDEPEEKTHTVHVSQRDKNSKFAGQRNFLAGQAGKGELTA